jgi:uncharacterized protein (DUF486 family)
MRTLYAALLLTISNVFMTFAWYGHLRGHQASALWKVVLASWGIAFFEYCFQVPANRIGAQSGLATAQLKTMQEVIGLSVFMIFQVAFLKEAVTLKQVAGFSLIAAGAALIFR